MKLLDEQVSWKVLRQTNIKFDVHFKSFFWKARNKKKTLIAIWEEKQTTMKWHAQLEGFDWIFQWKRKNKKTSISFCAWLSRFSCLFPSLSLAVFIRNAITISQRRKCMQTTIFFSCICVWKNYSFPYFCCLGFQCERSDLNVFLSRIPGALTNKSFSNLFWLNSSQTANFRFFFPSTVKNLLDDCT